MAFPNSHQNEDKGSKDQIIDQGNENKSLSEAHPSPGKHGGNVPE